VRDESGIYFWLHYDSHLEFFFYTVDEELSAEEWSRVDCSSEHLWLGRRSGFVCSRIGGEERLVLLGVRLDDALGNSYFDGPGDQVPFLAEIGAAMSAAYPNVMTTHMGCVGVPILGSALQSYAIPSIAIWISCVRMCAAAEMGLRHQSPF